MKEKFYYCQLQIEQGKWCKVQCSHCKEYYKPLEDERKEGVDNFAIEFTEWLERLKSSEIDTIDYDFYLRYNTEELLEIYKKEIK